MPVAMRLFSLFGVPCLQLCTRKRYEMNKHTLANYSKKPTMVHRYQYFHKHLLSYLYINIYKSTI